MPWGTLNTFLVSVYILVYIYDICWRGDIESSEPGAYNLFMSYQCQLGFSLEFPCNTEVEMKVLDTSSWKGLLCFVIQHSRLLCFSSQSLFVPLFAFVLSGSSFLFPLPFSCYLRPFWFRGYWSSFEPKSFLKCCVSLPSLCMGPGTFSSSFSHHLCLSHC